MKNFIIAIVLVLSVSCAEKKTSLVTSLQNEFQKLIPNQTSKQNITTMYTVFVTRDIAACKDFYMKWFNYSVRFESSWFILLESPQEHPVQLAFIDETHPSSPPSPQAFSGHGAFLTVEVPDATSAYQAMKKSGASFSYHLKDEPWGQRRFAITDPNGLWIDIVQQIEPQSGWWDPYVE